jgi:alkylation response protein AidB-like acyl-CoA dehydrogenase
MIAARATGAAERALRTATDWAAARPQFGRPIIEFQLIQGLIADRVADIATDRALVRQVAWEADHGLSRKGLHAKPAIVKLSASEAAGRMIDRAVQILGGAATCARTPASAYTGTSASTGSGRGHLRDPAPSHRQRGREARPRQRA